MYSDSFYEKILSQLTKCEQRIDIDYFAQSDELQQILYRLKSSHPGVFHLASIRCEHYPATGKGVMYPTYYFPKDVYSDYVKQISSKIKPIKQKLASFSSCADKEAYIHDYLCQNVKYFDDNSSIGHCLVGPMLYGKGVCDGISQAAQFLFKAGGMKSYVVFGNAKNSLNSDYLPHAWTVVEVDGKWYHLDVTYDLTISDQTIRYDYYNLSTDQIKKDHRIEYMPKGIICNTEKDYYYERNLIFRGFERLERYFDFIISKKREHFQFRADIPYSDKLYDDVIGSWRKVVGKNNISVRYQISVNQLRSVFAFDTEYS